jgi:hypothetical protein
MSGTFRLAANKNSKLKKKTASKTGSTTTMVYGWISKIAKNSQSICIVVSVKLQKPDEQKFQTQCIPKEGSYSFKQIWKITTFAHSLA